MKAVLVKRRTDDGTFEVEDHVPLGREYDVLPNTRRFISAFHLPTGKRHTKEIVMVKGHCHDPACQGHPTPFPTELLKFPTDA